jgi:GntR family transcriptional regulator
MIRFHLNQQSGVPAYLQLVKQVEHALRVGLLVPGDRLPSVRDVVADLVINPNTVAKAYRELEIGGLVQGKPGVGTFVVQALPGPEQQELETLRADSMRWVDRALSAGLDEESIIALVADAVRHLRGEQVA